MKTRIIKKDGLWLIEFKTGATAFFETYKEAYNFLRRLK